MLQRVSWTMSMTSLLACSEIIYRSGWVQLNDKWWLWLHTCWGELLKWHAVVGTWVKQSLVKAAGQPSNSCLFVRVVVVGPNNTSVLHLGHGAKEVSVVMVASWNAGHWFTFDRKKNIYEFDFNYISKHPILFGQCLAYDIPAIWWFWGWAIHTCNLNVLCRCFTCNSFVIRLGLSSSITRAYFVEIFAIETCREWLWVTWLWSI